MTRKLIVLWTLNRQAKIFLRVGIFSIASETLLLIILYLSNRRQSIIVLIASKISCACYFKKDWSESLRPPPKFQNTPVFPHYLFLMTMNERITQVQHGTFTPLVMSVTKGMGQESWKFYSRLLELISEERESSYSIVATTKNYICNN